MTLTIPLNRITTTVTPYDFVRLDEKTSVNEQVIKSSDEIYIINEDETQWTTVADFTDFDNGGVDIDELIAAL